MNDESAVVYKSKEYEELLHCRECGRKLHEWVYRDEPVLYTKDTFYIFRGCPTRSGIRLFLTGNWAEHTSEIVGKIKIQPKYNSKTGKRITS